MQQKKAGYPLEFKLQAIRLVKESGQPLSEIAKSLGIPKSTLWEWVRIQDEETTDTTNKRK